MSYQAIRRTAPMPVSMQTIERDHGSVSSDYSTWFTSNDWDSEVLVDEPKKEEKQTEQKSVGKEKVEPNIKALWGQENKTTDQVTLLSYLEKMNGVVEYNIDEVLIEVFFKPGTTQLQTDHKEINKILFRYKPETLKIEKYPDKLLPELKEFVDESNKRQEESRTHLLNKQETRKKELIDIEKKLKNMLVQKPKILEDTVEIFQRIQKDFGWRLVTETGDSDIKRDWIHLYTPNIKLKDPVSGLVAHLGEFKVLIYVYNFELRIKRYKNNIHSTNMHPYVSNSTEGELCAGEEQRRLNDVRKVRDLYETVKIIHEILVTYSQTSQPYRSIYDIITNGTDETGRKYQWQKDIPKEKLTPPKKWASIQSYNSVTETWQCGRCGFNNSINRELQEREDHNLCGDCGRNVDIQEVINALQA